MPTGDRPAWLLVLLAVSAVSAGSAQANPQNVVSLEKLDDPVRLEQQLRGLPADASITVPNGQVYRGTLRIATGQTVGGSVLVLRGDANVSGKLSGNLVVLDGNIVLEPGGVVAGDALVVGGGILDRGGEIQGERRSLHGGVTSQVSSGSALGGFLTRTVGLAGVFFTLTLLGFGMVLFGQPQLETISDTVSHSVFRAFATGLLAQIVVLPTLGLFITGLVLSVVGIILVPFVLIVVPLAILAAVVLGFLAVAHAMGEMRIRRRLAAGARVGSANSYRYVLNGLSDIALLWGTWILVGWVPVAGVLVLVVALLTTWLLGTVGFGAALLSRGGTRPAFAGRYVPPEAMTDEYLWATPRFGVDAVKKPLK